MTGQNRRTSLALEGMVIVVSILLAFALDAWWEDAQLEREVYQELESVGRELRRNQELLPTILCSSWCGLTPVSQKFPCRTRLAFS